MAHAFPLHCWHTLQDVREIKGPITLIAGKARRLTFLECPQDLSAMIDAGEGRRGRGVQKEPAGSDAGCGRAYRSLGSLGVQAGRTSDPLNTTL